MDFQDYHALGLKEKRNYCRRLIAMIVDAYTHFCPLKYVDGLARSSNRGVKEIIEKTQSFFRIRPQFNDVKERLRDLDNSNIDVQVTSIVPGLDPNLLPLGSDEQVTLSRLINDGMFEVMRKTDRRILPVGSVRLVALESSDQDDLKLNEMKSEMRRAVKELGLNGFMVPTHIAGIPIDRFRSFWKEAATLEAPVLIHPTNTITNAGRPYEDEYDLMHVFGWPFETTLTLSRLVFSGIMEEYPGLKVIAHHLGGMIPFFAGRIMESYSERLGTVARPEPEMLKRLTKPPFEYFKMFYYDTAVGGSTSAVKCGYEVFGADQLVFATDYPYGPEGGRVRLKSYPDVVRQLSLPKEDEDKIFSRNIFRLLGIQK